MKRLLLIVLLLMANTTESHTSPINFKDAAEGFKSMVAIFAMYYGSTELHKKIYDAIAYSNFRKDDKDVLAFASGSFTGMVFLLITGKHPIKLGFSCGGFKWIHPT